MAELQMGTTILAALVAQSALGLGFSTAAVMAVVAEQVRLVIMDGTWLAEVAQEVTPATAATAG